MLPSAIRCCLLMLLFFPLAVGAATLEYSVRGIKGEPRKNVKAYLGTAPQTDRDRLNFIATARRKVQESLQALGYYRPEITIEVQRTDPIWQLRVLVDLGDPVRIHDLDIEILGPAADDSYMTELLSITGMAAGDVLHHGAFEGFRKKLLTEGQRRGYLDGEINQSRVEVNVEAGTADIVLRYDSGPRYRFGDIVYDHVLLDQKLLDSMATFAPGDYYDQSRLRRFQENLQKTNYFSSVIVQPLREQAHGDVVPIAVKLQAAKRHSLDVGLGYSTDTEERVSLTWRSPRINRYGHSQVTRLQYSPVNPSGRFTYSIPIADPLTDVLQLWARLEENEFGDINSKQVEAGVRRELKKGKWIYSYSLRGLNESWHDLYSSPSSNYLLPGGTLSSRQHTGALVDPSGGFNQLYTIEGGSQALGSDIDLLRFTSELRYIFTPWPRHRVVTRAELGAVKTTNGDRNDLAPSLSFFAGGSESIRGYAYQSLGVEESVLQGDGRTKTIVVGGDRLAIASLEYQYYFTNKWRGAIFVDGGDAFDAGDFDTKVGAGFGVHYITPVGAIRVELANSVSESNPDWYFHLTVGAEF
jgi:translocation and assembly module TamA